jgi:multidrug resistance efflux pump
MNEMPVSRPEQAAAPPPPPPEQAAVPPPRAPANWLRRWTLAILVIFVLLFGWTLIADRLTPYTSDASVRALVARVVPEVSGKVIEVAVRDNQVVRNGDLLYRIDPTPFDIAVERAEARLGAAGQAVGASTATVDAAEAKLAEELALRTNVREQAARVFELVRVGVYPPARGDQARSQLEAAEAQVEQAQASLEQARQALGPQGADNPQIREALAALGQARLDLAHTILRAPGDGVVSNLQLNIGQFATAGRPALTFLDARLVWLSAFLRENSLEYIRPGASAEVVLDVLPGRTLPARVVSVGWGVGEDDTDSTTGLPKTRQGSGGWLAPAQRFPVELAFETAGGPPDGVRYNARASVILYTGDHPVANALAKIWIRLISVLTFVS